MRAIIHWMFSYWKHTRGIAGSVAVVMVIFFSVPTASLAVTCVVPGTVEITPLTRPTARDAGIPDDQPCWNPSDPTIGMNAGQAKQYLDSLPKRPLSRCAPPTRENIIALNDTLAICAADFFKAYIAAGKTIYITSAFRDGRPGTAGDGSGKSANECAGGAPNSNHTRGVAMDVNPGDGNYPQLWEFAKQNPRFGVCFPHRDGTTRTNYPDRPHMVLAGIGGNEGGACSDQGVTQPCNGLRFTPGPLPSVTTPTNMTPMTGQNSPTNVLSNALRTMLTPPPPPIVPSQPIAPYYDPSQYFTPPPPYPTSTPNPPPTPTPPPPVPPTTITPPPSPPTSTTSTSTITLINGINNPVGIDVGTKPKIVGTSTVNVSSVPQTTFRSDDLSRSPMQFGLFTNKNPLFAILESLKQVLLKILKVIRPFGRPRV